MYKQQKYVPRPKVPAEVAERFQVMLQAAAGEITVTEAAQKLNMPRNHFQMLLHRGLKGFLEGISPHPVGRKPVRTEREQELETQLQDLQRTNQALQEQSEVIQRIMNVAAGMTRAQAQVWNRRAKRQRTAGTPGTPGNDPEDPDGGVVSVLLQLERQMTSLGAKAALAAAVIGRSANTVRRWRSRLSAGLPAVQPPSRSRRHLVAPETVQRVDHLVRESRGLMGACAIQIRVPEVSRRDAASLKRTTLIEMERERRRSCQRIQITQPGVVRGFDQFYLRTNRGLRVALIAADGAIPFRTSARRVPEYSGDEVARVLESDIERNGPPLVLRLDRASSHQVPRVSELLTFHGVLALHGPPRCPRFYGQTERMNREHRQWIDTGGVTQDELLDQELVHMCSVLNDLPRRSSLQGRSASDVWHSRPVLDVDRAAFREDVHMRAAHLRADHSDHFRGLPADFPERLAIEQALLHRGLLRRIERGWC